VTGAPLAVRNRPRGTIDAYAAAVGRWLVTRDGFDFLVFYLSDFDFASHAVGPERAHDALARSDEAVGALIEAAGGPDDFLERYAVILCSDHGQTPVREVTRLQDSLPDALVTASNRAGMVYTDDDPAALARRLDGNPAVDVVLWRDGDAAVARREGADGDVAQLDHPDAAARAAAALANPNAGELIVSAAAGWEFADLAGRHHLGGGSHGSLLAGDSEVPMLTVGVEAQPASIVDVMPAVLDHFGVAPPAYARSLARS
jgi:predicted AlkP superfamily pyrophosphatase or phosphodiesterase